MFRFTIRDVLWLMLVVGMAVGWWLQFAKLNEAERQNAAMRRRNNAMKSVLKDQLLIDFQELDGGGFSIRRSDELPKRLTEGKSFIGRLPVNPPAQMPAPTDDRP